MTAEFGLDRAEGLEAFSDSVLPAGMGRRSEAAGRFLEAGFVRLPERESLSLRGRKVKALPRR